MVYSKIAGRAYLILGLVVGLALSTVVTMLLAVFTSDSTAIFAVALGTVFVIPLLALNLLYNHRNTKSKVLHAHRIQSAGRFMGD